MFSNLSDLPLSPPSPFFILVLFYLILFHLEVKKKIYISHNNSQEVQEFMNEHPAVHAVTPQWAWDSINTVKARDEQEYK